MGEQSERVSLFALSPRQRACVVLRFYDDLTVPQVAQVLGCSDGAVKRYLNESMGPAARRDRAEGGTR